MRIAITGAGGFVGRSLTLRLAQQGHKILALDNDSRGSLGSVPEHPNLLRRRCDVLESDDLEVLFESADAVYHLAAINGTENFYRMPEKVIEVGVIGTHNVLKAALKSGVRRFYFASSSEVYDTPSIIPTPETVKCTVADVFNPRFSYSASKIAGELMTINYLRGTDTQHVIFRLHNVYGPQMGYDHVIPQLVKKVIDEIDRNPGATTVTIPLQGSGEETRSFVYIDDATRAIEMSTLGVADSRLIHIGTEQEIPIRRLAEEIGKVLGVEVQVTPEACMEGSPLRRCPDTTNLRGLGFAAEVSLREGLEKTGRWYAERYREGEGNTRGACGVKTEVETASPAGLAG